MNLLAITGLTVRQFLRAKALLVVGGICAFPVLFALIAQLDESSRSSIREILGGNIYIEFFSATLLPLAVLVLATATLGDELDDRTLQYLVLKPISRFRIVAEKFLAVLLVTVPIAWTGLIATWAVASWGDFDETRDLLWPMLASSLIGIIGFGSLFMLLSLFIQRAFLVGIFYVFIWETSLSRFLPGIRTISIRHYTQSYFVRLADDRRITLEQLSAERTVLITIGTICVISLVLATWRLRSMNLE